MKNIVFCIMSLFAGLSYAKHDLVIGNVTVINATSARSSDTLVNHWVGIKGDRIVTVSKRPIAIDQAKYIEGRGQFLIPGLMDSHVHLNTMPGLLPMAKSGNRASRALLTQLQEDYLLMQGKRYLYYGVTQVLDPANTAEGISDFMHKKWAPTAFYCGAVPIFNGYGAQGISYEKLSKQRPYFVHQHSDCHAEHTRDHLAAQTPAVVVKKMREAGAKCVKVFLEDGFGKANNIPLISLDTVKALKAASQTQGIALMAHANATDMQKLGITAKVDVFAHGNWNWLDEARVSQSKHELPEHVKAVADAIIEQRIGYQPSLNVIRGLTDVLRTAHLEIPAYKHVLTAEQRKWYTSKQGQWFAKQLIDDFGIPRANIIKFFEKKQQQGMRVLNYIYQKGGTILLGSDTPPAPIYSSQPGLATFWELRDMHKAGMDLTGIFAAATYNNAKQFTLLHDYGTVEQGKVANLLLLNSNPLITINAYDDINQVILNGQPRKRELLY